MEGIQKEINTATPMAEKISQQLTLSGRKGIFPVQFGVNEGVFMRADKGAFGDSQVNQPLLAEVKAKYMYALFEISGPTMSATRDNPGAFEEALSLQLENTIDGVKLDMARQVLGKGDGTWALVQSRTDTDTYVIDSPYGLTTYKSNRPVRNLTRKDIAIDVVDAGDGTTKHVTNSAITAVTHAATGTTIDFSPVETTALAADGDFVTRAGNRNLEIEGFFAAVQATGTYLNIARAGNTGWQGIVVDAAGGGASAVPLDPDMKRDTVDQIMEETGHAPDWIVCNFKQRRNIYNLYAPQIRYAPMTLPAGLRENSVTFDDIPVLVERFFPPEHIGFLNTRFWYHALDKDTEWIPGEAGTVLHFKLTSDLYVAVLRSYRNLVCLYPATQGFLWGLEE